MENSLNSSCTCRFPCRKRVELFQLNPKEVQGSCCTCRRAAHFGGSNLGGRRFLAGTRMSILSEENFGELLKSQPASGSGGRCSELVGEKGFVVNQPCFCHAHDEVPPGLVPPGSGPLPASSPPLPRRPCILFHVHADPVQPGVSRGQSSWENLLE